MNCYKVSYAAVWVSGDPGPGQARTVKEGTVSVLAEDGTAAGQIAAASLPNSPDEFHVNHVQEVARNVFTMPANYFAQQLEQTREAVEPIHEEEATLEHE